MINFTCEQFKKVSLMLNPRLILKKESTGLFTGLLKHSFSCGMENRKDRKSGLFTGLFFGLFSPCGIGVNQIHVV
jgi:hypothetical protein